MLGPARLELPAGALIRKKHPLPLLIFDNPRSRILPGGTPDPYNLMGQQKKKSFLLIFITGKKSKPHGLLN